MVEPASILFAVIVITIALIALLVIRPAITVTRGGKILAFVGLFIFPLLSGWMGYSAHVERSKSTNFCLSCHVMEQHGRSLLADDRSFLAATHFQNNLVRRDQACYTCHTDYTMYGDLNAKIRGMRHVWVQYFGTEPRPEEIRLYTPYNNRECLHCHLGARSFEEGATHNAEEGRMALIRANQLSCGSSGCHDIVHNIRELGTVRFWDPNNPTPPPAEPTGEEGELPPLDDAGNTNSNTGNTNGGNNNANRPD